MFSIIALNPQVRLQFNKFSLIDHQLIHHISPVRSQSYRFESPKTTSKLRHVNQFSDFLKIPWWRPSAGSNFRKICSVAALPRNFIRRMTRRAYLRRLKELYGVSTELVSQTRFPDKFIFLMIFSIITLIP